MTQSDDDIRGMLDNANRVIQHMEDDLKKWRETRAFLQAQLGEEILGRDMGFANMTQLEAARRVLKIHRRPMKAEEIAAFLLLNGYPPPTKFSDRERQHQSLSSSLFSIMAKNCNKVFSRHQKGVWKLAEHQAPPKSQPQPPQAQKASRRKKKKKKRKAR